jgi:hypothetical protein
MDIFNVKVRLVLLLFGLPRETERVEVDLYKCVTWAAFVAREFGKCGPNCIKQVMMDYPVVMHDGTVSMTDSSGETPSAGRAELLRSEGGGLGSWRWAGVGEDMRLMALLKTRLIAAICGMESFPMDRVRHHLRAMPSDNVRVE